MQRLRHVVIGLAGCPGWHRAAQSKVALPWIHIARCEIHAIQSFHARLVLANPSPGCFSQRGWQRRLQEVCTAAGHCTLSESPTCQHYASYPSSLLICVWKGKQWRSNCAVDEGCNAAACRGFTCHRHGRHCQRRSLQCPRLVFSALVVIVII